jgi:prevent-host-death family protein
MVKVSSTEARKNLGRYLDLALTEPVVITRNGRASVVILSLQEYERLKRWDHEVLGIDDFTADGSNEIDRAVSTPGCSRI